MAVALKHFGVAHATTTLARGNLVDALDQLGDREAARNLLTTCITDISKLAEQKEEQEAAGKGSGDAAAAAAVDAATAAAAGAKDGEVTPEMAAMLAVDSVKANTACIRAQIELARLEMKDKQFDRAIEVLDGALDMAKQKFGEETAEACECCRLGVPELCCDSEQWWLSSCSKV
jgi:tetratricopeptide (TPR) repeat protein